MIELNFDLAIIGGGPAGLAAALEAKKQGVRKVLILDRDTDLGGILQQCIHDGFGLQRFKNRLSGGQYAQHFIDEIGKTDIQVKLDTMVLEITKDKTIYACNQQDGMLKINASSIILGMGCRERTASQVFIFGSRPAGVLNAGTVQRYINMDGYLPGKEAVILGSGDIGLIMARRMTLEGINVKGVYEVMKNPGGLTRNVVQCLNDYNIPLHLSTTVTNIHGKNRIEGVTVCKVDEETRKPLKETAKYISCDLLVLAVGLIPENELSMGMGIEMSPITKGPVVDNNFETSIKGIFAAGNVAVVFDLVDYVSISGEIAARGAADHLQSKAHSEADYLNVETCSNISLVVPQRYNRNNMKNNIVFFLRAKEYIPKAILTCHSNSNKVFSKRFNAVTPSEMISFQLPPGDYSDIKIQLKEA